MCKLQRLVETMSHHTSWLISIGLAFLSLCGGAISPAAEPALIPRHAEWRYLARSSRPPTDWNQPGFDDSDWQTGATGIGYGDDDDRTVLTDMRGNFRTVQLRTTFELAPDAATPETLYLYLRFDDGFVAYLNGTAVASHSVDIKSSPRRVSLHEAEGFEEFQIKDAARLLRAGENLIAIEGHNAATSSSDFSIDPVLTATRLRSPDDANTAADYRLDIDELRRRMEDQSSYLTRRGYAYDVALDDLKASIKEETQFLDFARELHRIVMRLGDCHAHVSASGWPPKGVKLPFRPADTAEGVIALAINEDKPIDPECPYLDSIDGLPLSRWIDAAAQFVPSGSPQLIRRWSLRRMGDVTLLRQELGLPQRATVLLGLRSADGAERVARTLRLTRQRYSVAKVRLGPTRMLDGKIAYIRIPEMTSRVAQVTVQEIERLRESAGMILDVRDNGGGTQEVLRSIYGFFVPEDAAPAVNNIAAYRLSDQFKSDHIAYRPTFRAGWPGWSKRELQSIAEAAERFKPEWLPPEGNFSRWHYLVLSRRRSGRPEDEFFYYDNPVVVLCNAGSFSATDGFLSAFADLPQVTIVGEPSGGGSGARRSFRLPNTQIRVTLSSMASFRSNGKLFDGNGIEVDIEARPSLEDFLSATDSVLDQARMLIPNGR